MAFNVSEAAAYAVLISVCVLFTLMAMGSTGYLKCLPESSDELLHAESSRYRNLAFCGLLSERA